MKIIITALILCFMASVVDARCVSRVVSSDNKFLAYTEFTFICHNGMKGRTKVYDDKIISSGMALVLAPQNGEDPRYRYGAAVDIMTSPILMKDESECGFMTYSHNIHSFVPPSSYDALWSRPDLTFFTKGYTGHRKEDDECNDKQEVTGLFVGSDVVIIMPKRSIPYPRLAFNSLIVMHLNHLHGEGVFIQWEKGIHQWERDNFPSFHSDIFPWIDGIPLP